MQSNSARHSERSSPLSTSLSCLFSMHFVHFKEFSVKMNNCCLMSSIFKHLFGIQILLSHVRQTAPWELFNYWEREEWCWIYKFPVRLCLSVSGRQINATVTLSCFLHSYVPPCWMDDTYLARASMCWSSLLLMLVQTTEAETTHSKCFDAISQQSVKQKTFVAIRAA